MELQIVDAHLHLWDPDRLTYPWLSEVPEINQPFGLEAFHAQSEGITVNKMVFIQCECLPEQYLDEVNYITKLSASDPRIQGIIPWFPLEAPDAEERLETLLQNPLIKGIRRLEESPVSLFSKPAFLNNFPLLSRHQLSFDICAKNSLLGPALSLVERHPEVRYMVDHMGKPDIKNQEMLLWKSHIRLLAQNPNVYCKLSGLVTEADMQHWRADDLRPYFDYALEQFGIDRLVFGSDWPVVTLAASYRTWYDTATKLCTGFSSEELDKLFNKNASHFYRLNRPV